MRCFVFLLALPSDLVFGSSVGSWCTVRSNGNVLYCCWLVADVWRVGYFLVLFQDSCARLWAKNERHVMVLWVFFFFLPSLSVSIPEEGEGEREREGWVGRWWLLAGGFEQRVDPAALLAGQGSWMEVKQNYENKKRWRRIIFLGGLCFCWVWWSLLAGCRAELTTGRSPPSWPWAHVPLCSQCMGGVFPWNLRAEHPTGLRAAPSLLQHQR